MTLQMGGDVLTDAEVEAMEAAALVESLEERVRTADDMLNPDELAKAQGLWQFAQAVRQEATQRALNVPRKEP